MSFAYDPPMPEPVVVDVVAIEPLPVGANASRSALRCRLWSIVDYVIYTSRRAAQQIRG
jgi:hypothetical protein